MMYAYDLRASLGPDALVERHPELDFSDGDVLLLALAPSPPHTAAAPQGSPFSPSSGTPCIGAAAQASTPARYVVFRVHKFLLRHHSPVFEHLFEDATADCDGADAHDGVPVVHMPGDDAADLARILTYLYNPAYVPLFLSAPLLLPSLFPLSLSPPPLRSRLLTC